VRLEEFLERPGITAVLEGLREVAERVARGEAALLHVRLPTGYGKSTASALIAAALLGRLRGYEDLGDFAERVVHAVPTRYLVEDLVTRARELGLRAYAQAMFLDHSLRDPTFLASAIYTTVDSYALNFFKLPVGEIDLIKAGFSRGHFDVPRYAILSAVNVFDEYHLLTPGDSEVEGVEAYASRAWTAFYTIVEALTGRYRCPVVLETATPRSQAVEQLQRGSMRVEEVALTLGKGRSERRVVRDRDFTASLLEASYRTAIVRGDLSRVVLERTASLPKPLLVACNTIKEAVEVHDSLREAGEKAYLLHSQFTLAGRRERLRLLKRLLEGGRDFVLVSTQVVEVGVDLDFQAIISNAAPLSSLAQRVGRVNRRLEPCEHEVVIVYDESCLADGSYSHVYSARLTLRTLEALREALGRAGEKGIGWRMTVVEREARSGTVLTLTWLSERVYDGLSLTIDYDYYRVLLDLLNPLVEAEDAIRVLGRYGSLIRDDLLIPLYVPEEGEELAPGSCIDLDPGRLVPYRAGKLGLKRWRLEFGKAERVVETRRRRLLAVLRDVRGEDAWIDELGAGEIADAVFRGIVRSGVRGRRAFFYALVCRRERYDNERGLIA